MVLGGAFGLPGLLERVPGGSLGALWRPGGGPWLCFLIDFRVDFASIFVEFWMMCLSIFLIFFVEFAKSR